MDTYLQSREWCGEGGRGEEGKHLMEVAAEALCAVVVGHCEVSEANVKHRMQRWTCVIAGSRFAKILLGSKR